MKKKKNLPYIHTKKQNKEEHVQSNMIVSTFSQYYVPKIRKGWHAYEEMKHEEA